MLCTSGARSWSSGSSVARTASWRPALPAARGKVPDHEDRPSN
jgi:hypothetical protein